MLARAVNMWRLHVHNPGAVIHGRNPGAVITVRPGAVIRRRGWSLGAQQDEDCIRPAATRRLAGVHSRAPARRPAHRSRRTDRRSGDRCSTHRCRSPCPAARRPQHRSHRPRFSAPPMGSADPGDEKAATESPVAIVAINNGLVSIALSFGGSWAILANGRPVVHNCYDCSNLQMTVPTGQLPYPTPMCDGRQTVCDQLLPSSWSGRSEDLLEQPGPITTPRSLKYQRGVNSNERLLRRPVLSMSALAAGAAIKLTSRLKKYENFGEQLRWNGARRRLPTGASTTSTTVRTLRSSAAVYAWEICS